MEGGVYHIRAGCEPLVKAESKKFFFEKKNFLLAGGVWAGLPLIASSGGD